MYIYCTADIGSTINIIVLSTTTLQNSDMEKPDKKDMDKFIQDRYQSAMKYYWAASKSNKNWYKITRALTVILGALVTLIASLSSSEFIIKIPFVKSIFVLGTPILAALLTIIAGFSQSFQWGSAWQNMILTAQHLQKEFDNYLVTPENERKYSEEADKLNKYVIDETEGFFERMLGGAKPRKNKTGLSNNDN